jgi:hypothetical protein
VWLGCPDDRSREPFAYCHGRRHVDGADSVQSTTSFPAVTAAPTALSADSPPPATADQSTAAPGPTTIGQLPPELTGTFAVHIDRTDVAEPDQAGDWFLTLSPTTGYQVGRVASGVVENPGSLTVAGEQITFSNELGIGASPGPGVYSWVVTTDTLTFANVSDACAVRVAQTTARSYARCPDRQDTCRDVLR